MQNPIALAMIAAYLVGTTLLGMLMMRRSRGGDDWAVAGGKMGVLMIAVGIAGTRVGGAATYGVAGDVITGGVWNMWYAVNTFLALALIGIFYAVPYRRLGIQTVGEVFLQRFGSRRCQWLTSLCVQIEYLIVNIIEPYVIGRILTAMTGLPFGVSVLISGVIIVTYTALGGHLGIGGDQPDSLHRHSRRARRRGRDRPRSTSAVGSRSSRRSTRRSRPTEHARHVVVDRRRRLVAGDRHVLRRDDAHAGGVGLLQLRRGRSRRARPCKRAFISGGLIAAPMPLLAGLIGIETLAKYGAAAQLASYQTLTRLAIDINPWIGGIALAAVLAAVVSSGGPILLSSATMFVRDWIPASTEWTQQRAPARLSHDDHHLRHGRRGHRLARPDHVDPRPAALWIRDGRAAGHRRHVRCSTGDARPKPARSGAWRSALPAA